MSKHFSGPVQPAPAEERRGEGQPGVGAASLQRTWSRSRWKVGQPEGSSWRGNRLRAAPGGNPPGKPPASQRLQLALPGTETSSISIRRGLIIELGDFNGTGKFKCSGKYEYS